MSFLKYVVGLALVAALAACGGGGGSPGLPSGTINSITTSAPTALTVAVGSTQSYSIVGGKAPFKISSSNTQVATGRLDANNFSISSVATGTANITISDSAQQSTTVVVTVGNLSALSTTAPASLTIAKDTQRVFIVSGGVPGYTAESSDDRIASVSLSGTSLLIRGVAAGSTTVLLKDRDGSLVALSITVGGGSPLGLYTTAPASLTIAKDSQSSFTVDGGVAGYTVTSSDRRIATVSLSGTVMTITALAAGSTTLNIRDSAGALLNVSVTVGGSSPGVLFTTAPSPVNIASGVLNRYNITGGVQPYAATSSDTTVVQSSANGSTLTIQAGAAGSATIQISDAAGATLSIQVSVGSSTAFFINAPSAVTINAGSSAVYLLSGGKTPYTVVSSDVRVANAGIAGSAMTVSGLASGTANLQMTDAVGAKLSMTVTVGSTGAIVSQDPILKSAVLKDAAGAATNSISASGYTALNVLLTDPSGNGIPNQVISVSGDATQVNFPQGGTGLTNASGVATINVARASLVATGAGALTVTYSYKVGSITAYPNGTIPPTVDKVIATYAGYQLSAANITLSNMNVGAATLAAYGTRQISVTANINGVPVSSMPVQVNFTSTCGQISPLTASTNSQGVVVVSYTATDIAGTTLSTLGCSGKTVEISASTIGAAVVTKTLAITSAPATNMSFAGVIPTRIFLANSGGPTQAVTKFKLVNARGEPLLGQDVLLTLKTLNGGIPKASFGAVGSIISITATTNSDGEVSVPVFSGTVPTSVLVNAALVSNPLVQTDSAVLTIASGRPSQAQVSLSIGKLAIRGFNFDGGETTVTMSLADRQGNPVPDGTAVNFVTEGGVMIPPVCTTGVVAGNSQCTVTIRTQNPRPTNGLVSILAYVAGEEDFVDANFNNVYDCGESFTDLGTAYRDDTATANGIANPFITGEFSVPRSASSSACAIGVAPTPQAGDGVWGAADVRRQAVIVFSTDDLAINSPIYSTSTSSATWSTGTVITNQLTVSISDLNTNSVPSGSTIAVVATDNSLKSPSDGALPAPIYGTCTLTGQSHTSVPNALGPLPFSVFLKDCVAGDQVQITVTTPAIVKSINFTVP